MPRSRSSRRSASRSATTRRVRLWRDAERRDPQALRRVRVPRAAADLKDSSQRTRAAPQCARADPLRNARVGTAAEFTFAGTSLAVRLRLRRPTTALGTLEDSDQFHKLAYRACDAASAGADHLRADSASRFPSAASASPAARSSAPTSRSSSIAGRGRRGRRMRSRWRGASWAASSSTRRTVVVAVRQLQLALGFRTGPCSARYKVYARTTADRSSSRRSCSAGADAPAFPPSARSPSSMPRRWPGLSSPGFCQPGLMIFGNFLARLGLDAASAPPMAGTPGSPSSS